MNEKTLFILRGVDIGILISHRTTARSPGSLSLQHDDGRYYTTKPRVRSAYIFLLSRPQDLPKGIQVLLLAILHVDQHGHIVLHA